MQTKRVPLGMSLSVTFGVGLVLATVLVSEHGGGYGWFLFAASPFLYAFACAVIYGELCRPDPDRVVWHVMLSSIVPGAIASFVMLCVMYEGLGCLAMAAPLILIELGLGALAGAWVYRASHRPRVRMMWLLGAGLCYAGFAVADTVVEFKPPARKVTSSIEIAAPPEVVWRNVVSFSELPAPTEWLFKTGDRVSRARADCGGGRGGNAVLRFYDGAVCGAD